MVFADSNRASIRYIAESTAAWGVIPEDGKTRPLRFTSSTLSASKETVVSDELRADRMVSSVPEVGATSEGEVNFELSAGSQDDFLQAFVLGFWSRPMTFDFFKGNNVGWTANNQITVGGLDVADYFVSGRRIKTEGFLNPANNGYFEIANVAYSAPNTVITVTSTTSVNEAGSNSSKVLDANDVIVLNNTDVRLGTGGASTIDSNSNDAFAAAIAAGQLKVGQKIFVDLPVNTVAFDNHTVTWTDTGADGDQITVSDGLQVKLLESGVDYAVGTAFTVDATGVLTISALPLDGATLTIGSRTYTLVDDTADTTDEIDIGATIADTIANIIDAINVAPPAGGAINADVSAVAGPAANQITVTAKSEGTAGNSITLASSGAGAWDSGATAGGVDGGTEDSVAASFADAINNLRNVNGFKLKATVSGGVVTVFSTDNNSNFSVVETLDQDGDFSVSAKTPATAAGARGFFTITSAADDVLGVTPQPPTVAVPGSVTIKGSMLRNPGDYQEITPQSFTLETSFNDVNQHFIQNGMRVGTYSLDVSSGAIVTGTMAFQGRETLVSPVNRLGNTANYDVLESTATEVLNATTNVGDLTKNGQPLATAIQSLTLEGDASLRNQNAVGSKFPRGIGTGRFNLTGTMTAYFETLDLYADFLAHNTISIGWDFQDQDANVYFYTIPALKITSDPVNPSGIDQDVVEEMEWSALRDATTQCMLQVDRFSSILPR